MGREKTLSRPAVGGRRKARSFEKNEVEVKMEVEVDREKQGVGYTYIGTYVLSTEQ